MDGTHMGWLSRRLKSRESSSSSTNRDEILALTSYQNRWLLLVKLSYTAMVPVPQATVFQSLGILGWLGYAVAPVKVSVAHEMLPGLSPPTYVLWRLQASSLQTSSINLHYVPSSSDCRLFHKLRHNIYGSFESVQQADKEGHCFPSASCPAAVL